MNEIKVSILCTAYNQEKYIEDALKSFVSQKTSFQYEVLINDDASTDRTPMIIKEYENRYPDIIHAIYQKENQYHKVNSINSQILFPLSKGKYIALCEGDDYWTSNNKLQRQFEMMEEHPEIDMCAHRAIRVSANSKSLINYMAPAEQDTILSVDQVISGGGDYVATNSLFYRRELEANSYRFTKMLSLDYIRQIHGALRGGMLYLNECMSAYRWASNGSWTNYMDLNPTASIKAKKAQIATLELLNVETNYLYDNVIKDRIISLEFGILVNERKIVQIMRDPYKERYDSLSNKEKIKVQVKCRIPFIEKIIKYKVAIRKNK